MTDDGPPVGWLPGALAVVLVVALAGYLVLVWSPPGATSPPSFVDHPAEPSYPDDLDAVSVRLESGGCLGPCPVYTVEVCGNGTAFYVGYRNVNATGVHQVDVPRSNVTALLNDAYRIDYFALPEAFERRAVDAPTYNTSVTVGDATHQVSRPGFGGTPDRLQAFEAEIVNRSGVRDLVGHRGDNSLSRDERQALDAEGSFCR